MGETAAGVVRPGTKFENCRREVQRARAVGRLRHDAGSTRLRLIPNSYLAQARNVLRFGVNPTHKGRLLDMIVSPFLNFSFLMVRFEFVQTFEPDPGTTTQTK